jgi:ABC-type polar amino acid transport system, ATPase component
MLKINNLEKNYGENEVLKGISTEIKKEKLSRLSDLQVLVNQHCFVA